MKQTIGLMAALVAASPALADEQRSLHELMSGWGTNLDAVSVTSRSVADGLHVLRGAGGAILVSVGSDGVLLVDDQLPQVLPQIRQEIARLGGTDGKVDYVINTHWHFDHADGNPALGQAGATIVAHDNSRKRMQQSTRVSYLGYHYIQPAYPEEGLPVITFNDAMTVYFNDQQIDLRYFGPGHTTGDAAVFFSEANVVHVGDLYSGGYPYIDTPNGGSLAGLIAVCRSIAELTDADTRIVSGHAPVASREEFMAYIDMLEESHGILRTMAAEGLSLEQVLAAKPTAKFDTARGNPALFITMAYRSLGSAE